MKRILLALLVLIFLSSVAFGQNVIKYRTTKILGAVIGTDGKISYKEESGGSGLLIVTTFNKITIYDSPKGEFDLYDAEIDSVSQKGLYICRNKVVDGNGKECVIQLTMNNPMDGRVIFSIIRNAYPERLYYAKAQ